MGPDKSVGILAESDRNEKNVLIAFMLVLAAVMPIVALYLEGQVWFNGSVLYQHAFIYAWATALISFIIVFALIARRHGIIVFRSRE